ncbi:MAG TPA: MFS transporter [Gammaproteobacteria bacterium]
MLSNLFSSLIYRDFRLYFTGQLISVIGTWMQNVAQAWLVYRLSGSSFMLGLVAFAGLVPVLLLGMHGGLIADRFSRRRILIVLHILAMVISFFLAYLVNVKAVTPTLLVFFSLMLGTLHALEMPARHAFVAELVPREQLPNAVALSSSVFNLARFVGPGIAALLFSRFNESLIFSLNGLSFLIMLLILFMISSTPQKQSSDHQTSAQRLLEGFRYVWKVTEIRYALLLLATISLVSTAHSVLMPVFSREVFNGEAKTFSALIGSTGVGAFIAAMRLAYLSESSHLPVRIRNAVVVAGIAMLIFPLQHHVTPAFFILALLGFALTTTVATINTLIQLNVPDHLRGRVMALFSVLFIGLTSLGNLSAGLLGEKIGAPSTVILYGAICLLAGLGYSLCLKRCGVVWARNEKRNARRQRGDN